MLPSPGKYAVSLRSHEKTLAAIILVVPVIRLSVKEAKKSQDLNPEPRILTA